MMKKYKYFHINDPNKEVVGYIYGESLINARIKASRFKDLPYDKFIKIFEVELVKI